MEPTFPLPRHASPACKKCGLRCVRQTWAVTNRNGNAGRPFYTCLGSQHQPHPREFSTWDDYEGIFKGNPRCSCGYTSRVSTIKGRIPPSFFSCAVGGCGFSQNAPFTPGIRPGPRGNYVEPVAPNVAGPG
jgi:hypothetical protein